MLTQACDPNNVGDVRWFYVRLLPEGKPYLNDQPLSAPSLRTA